MFEINCLFTSDVSSKSKNEYKHNTAELCQWDRISSKWLSVMKSVYRLNLRNTRVGQNKKNMNNGGCCSNILRDFHGETIWFRILVDLLIGVDIDLLFSISSHLQMKNPFHGETIRFRILVDLLTGVDIDFTSPSPPTYR